MRRNTDIRVMSGRIVIVGDQLTWAAAADVSSVTTEVTTGSAVEVMAAFLASCLCLFSSILSRSRSETGLVRLKTGLEWLKNSPRPVYDRFRPVEDLFRPPKTGLFRLKRYRTAFLLKKIMKIWNSNPGQLGL